MIYARAVMRTQGVALRPVAAAARTVALTSRTDYTSVTWDPADAVFLVSYSSTIRLADSVTGAPGPTHPATRAVKSLSVFEGDLFIAPDSSPYSPLRLTGTSSATVKTTYTVNTKQVGMAASGAYFHSVSGGNGYRFPIGGGAYTPVAVSSSAGLAHDGIGLIRLWSGNILVHPDDDLTSTPVRTFAAPAGTVNIGWDGNNLLSITNTGIITVHDKG